MDKIFSDLAVFRQMLEFECAPWVHCSMCTHGTSNVSRTGASLHVQLQTTQLTVFTYVFSPRFMLASAAAAGGRRQPMMSPATILLCGVFVFAIFLSFFLAAWDCRLKHTLVQHIVARIAKYTRA